jgi:hypothetical protein
MEQPIQAAEASNPEIEPETRGETMSFTLPSPIAIHDGYIQRGNIVIGFDNDLETNSKFLFRHWDHLQISKKMETSYIGL